MYLKAEVIKPPLQPYAGGYTTLKEREGNTYLVSVAGGAIHQVLLGIRDELSALDEVDTLNGTSGGERPARSALALVLDGWNVE